MQEIHSKYVTEFVGQGRKKMAGGSLRRAITLYREVGGEGGGRGEKSPETGFPVWGE